MALTETKAAPAWISALYLGGLVLLYLGQRVLIELEGPAQGISILAVVCLVAATAARFVPAFQGRGDHAPIARLLSGLQLLGIVGVGIYGLSTEAGLKLLGLTDSEQLEIVGPVLQVAWMVCVSISAVALVFAEFALNPMRNAPTLEGRRVSAAATSGLVLALAASYGSLFVYAATQAEEQADFSYFKTSQPGEATVKLVQKLSEPLQITGFFPEVSEVRKEVHSYLSALKERSGNLEFSLVDRYLEPNRAKELRVTQDGMLVLVSGETKGNLPVGTEIRKARATLMKLDQEINSRLSKIARDRRVAYMTVGHGELNDRPLGESKAQGRTSQLLAKILEQQNYRIKDLGLNQGLGSSIPDDADLVMVLGPVHPFSAEEIDSLRRYAESGGKLLMALDVDATLESDTLPLEAPAAGQNQETEPTATAKPTGTAPSQPEAAGPDSQGETPAPSNPAGEAPNRWLQDLAAAVGASFEPVVLADEQKHIIRSHNDSDRVLLSTNRFSSHASVSTLSRNSGRASVVAFGASHLGREATGGRRVDVAVRTYGSTFADTNRNFKLDDDEAKKVYNLAVAITGKASATEGKPDQPEAAQNDEEGNAGAEQADKKKAEQAGKKKADDPAAGEMRAFVVADADAFSDLVMGRVVANRMLAFDAVRWLVGEESLAGEIESEEDVTIEQTKQRDLAWFYATIFGIPALVLGGGLLTSQRARRASRRASDRPAGQPPASPPQPPQTVDDGDASAEDTAASTKSDAGED